MDKAKLFDKCLNRIGMTVFVKDTMRRGEVYSFQIIDNPDGTYSVNYMILFSYGKAYRLEMIHESKIVLLKGSER